MKASPALVAFVLACASTLGSGGRPDPAPKGTGSTPTASASEDSPCETAADCAFTRVEAGECCPMLCSPRAVTSKRAAELAAKAEGCNAGRGCPQPLCQPPRNTFTVACEGGRCVARASAVPEN